MWSDVVCVYVLRVSLSIVCVRACIVRAHAYACVLQATRLNRDSWRMTSNLVVAATKCRQYAKCISSMHQLVDLRRKDQENTGVDVDCLRVLVHAIVGSVAEQQQLQQQAAVVAVPEAVPSEVGAGVVSFDDGFDDSGSRAAAPSSKPAFVFLDNAGGPVAAYLDSALRLFSHITSAISRNAHVWRLYAKLYTCKGNATDARECYLREVRGVGCCARVDVAVNTCV
jgi:hypothetical protein